MKKASRTTLLRSYYDRVRSANVEQAKKEQLLGLLRDLFGSDTGALEIIRGMESGSEWRVENIPVHHRRKTGKADTQHRNLIIEFEKDLAKTGPHAADQLAEYLAGNWRSGNIYEFTMIATDCLTWIVYAPRPDSVDTISTTTHVDASVLMEVARYEVTLDSLECFPSFLDRYLFRLEPERATIESIVRVFGVGSPTFYHAVHSLTRTIDEAITSSPSLKVAFTEWERLLQIAYGTYKGDTRTYAVHTYLSMLAKMLAYEVLTGDVFIDDAEIQAILTGEIFASYNVADFVERDFYGWINDTTFMSEAMAVARMMADSLSDLDFREVNEDILKGIYQSLIDVRTRHGLGEYYTPDWLCEQIIRELNPRFGERMLDPACGSGSFIRAYIQHLQRMHPESTAEELSASTYGIDVNPLSVQIAKATKLVAIGPAIRKAHRPVRLNVFLANALYTPQESLQLFAAVFQVNVNDAKISFNLDMFKDLPAYDQIIDACETLAEATLIGQPYDRANFTRLLRSAMRSLEVIEDHAEVYYKLYIALRDAKVKKQDSIWKFILQNVYKPLLVKHQFDYVIGNPPWLTYSQIAKGEYQDVIYKLAERYHLTPRHKKNMPHLEMAVIFLAHSAAYFLQPAGRGALVMPRSLLSADHHANLRDGRARDVLIQGLWDLDRVTNLFPVPSCVVFFAPGDVRTTKDQLTERSLKPIAGREISGNIPLHNMSYTEVQHIIKESEVTWTLRQMNTKNAWTTSDIKARYDTNPYKEQFKQGATIVPRSVMFVDCEQDDLATSDAERLMLVETSAYARREAKEPWKDILLKGRVPVGRIFRVPLANSIFPYAIVNPSLVVLPVRMIPMGNGYTRLSMITADDMLNDGDHDSYQWFHKAEAEWEAKKSDKSGRMTLQDRVNYQRLLQTQVISDRDWYVCYNASGTDACAGAFQQSAFDRPVVFDAKAYWARFSSEDEAQYVVAHLNSPAVNRQIKDFQSRGLWGARDIHTTILNIGLAAFDPTNPDHMLIATTSRRCGDVSTDYLAQIDLREMSPHKLGRIRSELRTILADHYYTIDRAFGWVT